MLHVSPEVNCIVLYSILLSTNYICQSYTVRSKQITALSLVCVYVPTYYRLVDTLEAFLDQIGKPQLPEGLLPDDVTVGETPSVWECVVTFQHNLRKV